MSNVSKAAAESIDTTVALIWQCRWAIDGGLWSAWNETTEKAGHADLARFPDTYQLRVIGVADGAPLTWEDARGATHTISRLQAQEVLKNLFDRWPAGLCEVEAVLRKMREEVARLRGLAATCYAGLGAECNLPEAWLDVLSAAANGEPFDSEGLLPYAATSGPAQQAPDAAPREVP